jgi:flagellar hook-associated protein 1 FlgK
VTAGDPPNDLLDRRDMLLDKLSNYGQLSVTSNTDGTVSVAFADQAKSGPTQGQTYPIVDGATASWAGPPAAWSPGGQLGGLLAVADPTTGTLQGYLGSLDTIAGDLATAVNTAYGSTFFQTGTPAAATLEVAPGIVASPATITAGSGNAGSNDLAQAVAALGNGAVDSAYRSFIARVGAEVQSADRQAANGQALTDAVENRRQSVAGVSLDEEMSNLVRFQRGYQASSRAMSTMDEMLDVLINRTGRVGL